MHTYREELAME